MTTERKVIIALVALLFAGGLIGGYEVLKAHDAILSADVQKKADAVAKEKIDKAIGDRDAELKEYQNLILKQQAAVKSSGQAVQVIEHYVPSAAPQVVVQRQDLTPAEQAKLPDAPSYVITTQQQAINTAKVLLQCDADEKALNTCKADLGDTKDKEQIAEAAAKTWEKAAKGGSKWRRVYTAGKYIVIGGAVGYLAGHKF